MNALPEPFYGRLAAILRPYAFQAGCRGFEPRLPLQIVYRLFTGSPQAASWQASGERVSKQAVLCCANMQVSLILSRQGSLSKRRTAKPHPLTPSLAPLLLLLPSTQRKQDRSPLNRLQRRQRAYQQRRAMSPPRAPPCPVVGSLRRLTLLRVANDRAKNPRP